MTPRNELPAVDVDECFRRFCADGDSDALAEVFAAVAPWLTRRAMQLTRDPLSAMDLVQGTFVTAIEIRARFDPQGKARPWLRGILENKARRPAARITVRAADVVGPFDPAAPVHGPDEHAVQGELADIVRQAIERLPEPYRVVVQRALLHEETAEQIAAALARPWSTVRSQIKRGLQRLRLALPAGFGALLRAFRGSGQAATTTVGLGVAAVVLTWIVYLALRQPVSGPPLPVPAAGPAGTTMTKRAEPEAGRGEQVGRGRTSLLPIAPPIESMPTQSPWTIAVQQVDGTPTPDIEFVLDWGRDGRRRVFTDGSGLVRVAAPADPVAAIVEVPFAGVRRGVDDRAASASARQHTLVLPPGFSVAGGVVDDAGRPWPAASIVWIDDDAELQVARSDAEGRFLVRNLSSGARHRLRAVLGSRCSAEVDLVGAAGTTAEHTFRLDREVPPPASAPGVSDERVEPMGPLTVEFLVPDGTVLHDWLAVLSRAAGEVVAARTIVGNVASFPPVPLVGLRCTLLPPDRDGGAARNDAQLLTRRHGSLPRALQRQGERAVLEVRGDELPSAWLRLTSVSSERATLAERAVLLDRSGRPHGIFLRPGDGIGPIRPGTWTLALLAAGQQTEYRGPFEIASGGVYAIADLLRQEPAVLRLRGVNGQAIDPPLEALWICAADVLLTLEPRANLADDLRLAPGDYVVHWRQQGLACAGVAVRAASGCQDLVLAASPGQEVALLFDYGRTDPAVASDGRIARLDVTVRDDSGEPMWRERLHAPTDAEGRLQVTRRLGDGSVLVEAVDADGARGVTRLRPGDEQVRIVMVRSDGDRTR